MHSLHGERDRDSIAGAGNQLPGALALSILSTYLAHRPPLSGEYKDDLGITEGIDNLDTLVSKYLHNVEGVGSGAFYLIG